MNQDMKWVSQVLTANGLRLEDVLATLHLHPAPWTQAQWDLLLGYLNDLPALDYPAASIMDELEALDGQDMVLVSYGVSSGQLIFTGFEDMTTGEYHGSPANAKTTAHFPLTVLQARDLFFKQNCTLHE